MYNQQASHEIDFVQVFSRIANGFWSSMDSDWFQWRFDSVKGSEWWNTKTRRVDPWWILRNGGLMVQLSMDIATYFFINYLIYIYIYIDGLKLRMRTWKRHSTRAKLKNCILPAFRNLECVPPPRMKLFGNQQLECLHRHMFFSRQKHIYIYIYPRPSKSP